MIHDKYIILNSKILKSHLPFFSLLYSLFTGGEKYHNLNQIGHKFQHHINVAKLQYPSFLFSGRIFPPRLLLVVSFVVMTMDTTKGHGVKHSETISLLRINYTFR